jgi:hypothetical protein
MKLFFPDIAGDYIFFSVQCTGADGEKTDPSAILLIVYEESGADGTFTSAGISGSPFSPGKLNSKTGYYGVGISKSAFTAGRQYCFLWEATIDGVATAYTEIYFAAETAVFQADISAISAKTAQMNFSDGKILAKNEDGEKIPALGEFPEIDPQVIWEYTGGRTITGYASDSENPAPPVYIPPDFATDCRIVFSAAVQASIPEPEIEHATCRILMLPKVASGRFYTGKRIAASYDTENGVGYWDVVRGAVLSVTVPLLGLNNAEITVPDQEILDLATIYTP